jgi:hypothetical protein
MGDRVHVKIVRVSLDTSRIDFVLASADGTELISKAPGKDGAAAGDKKARHVDADTDAPKKKSRSRKPRKGK